jgi:hypothetical protein
VHKSILRALVFVSVLAVSAGCASAGTVWTLVDVTFSDGATATGFFAIDSGFTMLTNWDITVSGSDLGADFVYTPADSNYYDISATEIALGANPFATFTVLIPDAAMTNAGGTIDLVPGNSSVDCSAPGPCGALLTGAITTEVVPEPGTILLSACGAAAAFWMLYRRRTVRITAPRRPIVRAPISTP